MTNNQCGGLSGECPNPTLISSNFCEIHQSQLLETRLVHELERSGYMIVERRPRSVKSNNTDCPFCSYSFALHSCPNLIASFTQKQIDFIREEVRDEVTKRLSNHVMSYHENEE